MTCLTPKWVYTCRCVCVSDKQKTENLLRTNYFSGKQNMLLAHFWHRHLSNNNRASGELICTCNASRLNFYLLLIKDVATVIYILFGINI